MGVGEMQGEELNLPASVGIQIEAHSFDRTCITSCDIDLALSPSSPPSLIMQFKSIPGLFFGATVTWACTLPTDTLSNTITQGFQIQVQNASQPAVHNKFMNLLQAGGGDQHLFIGPVGTPTFFDLTLVDGVITHGDIRAVINGEV